MKRIKSLNGYSIFEAGQRDVKKYGFTAGSFYVYFASDIRDFGLENSTPEFEDCGSLEEAEANCAGNFARAKEIVEGRTTAAGMEEILEVEAQLDAGADPDDIADADPMTPDATGSLRDVARECADHLREGIPWVIIYRAGRSWACLSIWSDVWNEGFETDDLNHALEILKIDPGAVILNGYYCGHLGENMTIDELTDGIRWHYENGHNRLADCEGVQQAQESIETARAAAKAAGLPFSERLSEGAEDEPDPYTYDGSMSPEDYELMNQNRERAELAEIIDKHFPDAGPEKVAELTERIRTNSPGISPETLDALLTSGRQLIEAIMPALEQIMAAAKQAFEALASGIGEAIGCFNGFTDAALYAACEDPKHWHYYKHAKKARTRKKYRHRLERSLARAIAASEAERS